MQSVGYSGLQLAGGDSSELISPLIEHVAHISHLHPDS